MRNRFLSLALALSALSLTAVCGAATTPEGTLKEFLKAMQKKDRKSIQKLVDWELMGEKMNAGKSTPEEREKLMRYMKVIYTESFALGKRADGFKVSPVAVKGDEAKGAIIQQDKATKKWVPTTQFLLKKKGKDWFIYSISGVKKA